MSARQPFEPCPEALHGDAISRRSTGWGSRAGHASRVRIRSSRTDRHS
jgi:hypothetical protein